MLKSRPRKPAKSLTEEESMLWTELRAFRKLGYAVRRQVEIGPFTVDFLCRKANLIIEVDGEHHGRNDAQWDHDQERSEWLRSQGYDIIRFWNGDIREDITAVVETIFKRVKERSAARYSQPVS